MVGFTRGEPKVQRVIVYWSNNAEASVEECAKVVVPISRTLTTIRSLVKEVRGRGANGHMLEILELLERGPRAGYSWAFEPYPFKP